MGKLEDETIPIAARITGSVGADSTRIKADNRLADIIKVEINLNIFILAGAVKGIGRTDILFHKSVDDEFINAIKKFQRHVVGMSNPDGRVDPNGRTLKFLNGPISARGGKVTPGKNPVPDNVAAARKKIANTAGKYLNEGGHFLMGAMGDMPKMANGHPVRPVFSLPATFIDEKHHTKLGPSINAAWVKTGKFGILGCMGRPKKKGFPNNGQVISQKDKDDIKDYTECIRMAKDAGVSASRWPGFDVYRSKKIKFDTATKLNISSLCVIGGPNQQYPRRISPNGQLHLGETCVGHRHYDCIGFVNFVLSKVLVSRWAQSMEFYMKDSTKFDVTEFADSDKAKVISLAEPGDLVFKSKSESHCGIIREVNGRILVTNCRGMSTGLINSSLTAEWKFLARLKSI